mmetsp:Transcript_67923/g.162190  ORF Transcript_67923/g.162190 Transcript_67923/m.162190 type:complete len:202 (-) Transcript_67923:154-759(-)
MGAVCGTCWGLARGGAVPAPPHAPGFASPLFASLASSPRGGASADSRWTNSPQSSTNAERVGASSGRATPLSPSSSLKNRALPRSPWTTADAKHMFPGLTIPRACLPTGVPSAAAAAACNARLNRARSSPEISFEPLSGFRGVAAPPHAGAGAAGAGGLAASSGGAVPADAGSLPTSAPPAPATPSVAAPSRFPTASPPAA